MSFSVNIDVNNDTVLYPPNELHIKVVGFIGLFDFLMSSSGDPLAGSSTVADFSETNSFRI